MERAFLKLRPLIRSVNTFNNNGMKKSIGLKQVTGISLSKYNIPTRKLSTSTRLFSSTMDNQFLDSQSAIKTLKEEPDNDIKLKLYSLFKQGSVGKCSTPKPGALDFVGKAKWNAWNSLGDMSQEQAKKEYVSTVAELLKAEGQTSSASSSETSQYFGLKVTNEDGVLTIMLNRPEKKNAITPDMYASITGLLNNAGTDDNVKFVVLKGAGDYFSSGNDLTTFMKMGGKNTDLQFVAKKGSETLMNYVDAYIKFPKPLVAVVNGPAVGICVTILGLCDVVYANETATFHTPFSALGQSPEACSSYTFPKIMGYVKANEMLMLNKKINVQEALRLNLVCEVFPKSTFDSEVDKKIKEMASLPRLSLAYAKQLTRNEELETLLKVNRAECIQLTERWQSEDCKKAIVAFFSGKSKI